MPTPPGSDRAAPPKTSALRAKSQEWIQRLKSLFEKYRDFPPVDVAVRLYERDFEASGTLIGSAIALKLFLYALPTLLFIVGLAGVFSGHLSAQSINENVGISGGLANQVRAALQQQGSTRWVALVIGFFGMLTAGRSLSRAMATASRLSWRQARKNRTSLKIDGALIGLLGTISLISMIVSRINSEYGVGAAGVSFIGAFAVYLVAWLVISILLPSPTEDPGALLPGALLIAITIAGMQAFSQLYLPDKIHRASDLYGAIGTSMVALGWFFILGRAIVFSLTLNAVIWERFGSITQFVFGLPVLRILPRKSRRFRKLFDIDLGGE